MVCLFAFIGLMSIWYHIGRNKKDLGQVYLALSVLCWSASGFLDVYCSSASEDMVLYRGLSSILSLCNSLFILLALPWFRYIPDLIKSLIKSDYWLVIIGLPFLFSLFPIISSLIRADLSSSIAETDVYYSVMTLLFLGVVLWQSFAKRRLLSLAYLSACCILITFAAQLLKLSGASVNLVLFSAIFKTCLIMMFFALALSWVKELAENVIPDASSLSLHLTQATLKDGKLSRQLMIKGMPGHVNGQINLTPSMYDLLYTFIERRMTGDGWLEIKPKAESRTGQSYEINDHNQIKRLNHAILDGLFGKHNWTKEIHEVPLKKSLFELSHKRERKIRLMIPPDNLTLPVNDSL